MRTSHLYRSGARSWTVRLNLGFLPSPVRIVDRQSASIAPECWWIHQPVTAICIRKRRSGSREFGVVQVPLADVRRVCMDLVPSSSWIGSVCPRVHDHQPDERCGGK